MKATVKIFHLEAEGDADTIGALLRAVTDALVPELPAPPVKQQVPTRKAPAKP